MSAFLLEVLSEEIPAHCQGWGAAALTTLLCRRLQALGVPHGVPQSYATPRRLAVALDGLPARIDRDEERKGPREGAPEAAIAGFARSAGVARAELELRQTGAAGSRRPGRAWFAVIRRPGVAVADLLAEAVPDAMAAMPWPRSMRWGSHEVRWVRPVLSILALFDGAVVPFRFGPIAASATTRGHRVLAPAAFEVAGFDDYRQRLEAAFVLIDAGERRRRIARDAARLAAAEGLTVAGLAPDGGDGEDEAGSALLDEVAGLVEWPLATIAGFDPAFMALPAEVLATAMRRHQRYFPLRDASGALAPRFVFVADRAPASQQGDACPPRHNDVIATVAAGNRRVLAARLADARHFWDSDREQSLESRLPALAGILFHAQLGSVADRAARLERLAPILAHRVPGCDGVLAARAGRLAKADLASLTVGEFPELQGAMGGHYARHDGEDEAVAQAIAEHYAPRGPAEACPTRPLSVALALADKIDALAGFFAIGRQPTGSRDPFALRRAALGVVRLVLENRLRLPLGAAFAAACQGWRGPVDAQDEEATVAGLVAFTVDRLEIHLLEAGWQRGAVRAVLRGAPEDDLARALARLEALAAFLAGGDGPRLLAARRRAANIVRIEQKKDGQSFAGACDHALLVEEQERALAAALAAARTRSRKALAGERFADAMAALAGLREPLDAFFEHVTVNAARPGQAKTGAVAAGDLRANRLRLLAAVARAMDEVADFSAIEPPRDQRLPPAWQSP